MRVCTHPWSWAVWAIFVLSPGLLPAQSDGPPQKGQAKMSPLEQQWIAASDAGQGEALALDFVRIPAANSSYRVLQIEFKDEKARKEFRAPEWLTPFNEFQQWADAFLEVPSP